MLRACAPTALASVARDSKEWLVTAFKTSLEENETAHGFSLIDVRQAPVLIDGGNSLPRGRRQWAIFFFSRAHQT